MSEPSDQFKRAPRRKADRGKKVAMSAEAKQAYADLMNERDKREREYARYLPPTEKPK